VGVTTRLHAASAALLLPALTYAPLAGTVLLAVWLAFARPRRPAAARVPALALAAVVTVLGAWHGGPWNAGGWSSLAMPVAAAAALAWGLLRLDAAAYPAAAAATGVGGAITALALTAAAVLGGAGAAAAGAAIEQATVLALRPSNSAALALALAAGSALCWLGGWPTRALGASGAAAALLLTMLTGSRSGFVAAVVAALTLVALGLGHLLARGPRSRGVEAGRRRARAATLLVAGAAVLLLAGLQALLLPPGPLARGWPTPWPSVDGGVARDPGAPATEPALLARLRKLEGSADPSGGRWRAWAVAGEVIAARPLLGYGFDALERVYAPAAAGLPNPPPHPYHRVLSLLLQGGALLTAAVLALVASLVLRLLRAALSGPDAPPGATGASTAGVAGTVAAITTGLLAAELLNPSLHLPNVAGVAVVVTILAIPTMGAVPAASGAAVAAAGEASAAAVASTASEPSAERLTA
jgi:hypothetical protein